MRESFRLEIVTSNMIGQLCDVAIASFRDDDFYRRLFPAERMDEELRQIFDRSTRLCTEHGLTVAARDSETGDLAGFMLLFDYNGLKRENAEGFRYIFDYPLQKSAMNISTYIDGLIGKYAEYLYLLAIAVAPSYRRRGIASHLISSLQRCYSQYNLFSDVSNPILYNLLCSRFGFENVGMADGCRLVRYVTNISNRVERCYNSDRILVAVPQDFPIEDAELLSPSRPYRISGLCGNIGTPYFSQDITFGSLCNVRLLEFSAMGFRNWLRTVCLLACEEHVIKIGDQDVLCYLADPESDAWLHVTPRLQQDAVLHSVEWSVVPDVYTLIPVEYSTLGKFDKNRLMPQNVRRLLQSLNFRTKYEAGIMAEEWREGNSFESRISRIFLEMCRIQIYCESAISFDGIRASDQQIGEPDSAALILSYDTLTHCGVLHIVMLSSSLLLTQYLDSVSRNQISVIEEGGKINLYDYIERKYGLHKRGSAKNYVALYESRDDINNDFLASVLYCETYYQDGEVLGRVIDPEIIGQLKQPRGASQYDYATAYFYKNVIVHICDAILGVRERIVKESVTLFYAEMTLFEEATMEIMNYRIIRFLTEVDRYKPGKLMQHINMLLTTHVKSIAFWNLHLNYPSSRKSMDLIRDAFEIGEQRKQAELNKKQLMSISQARQNYFSYVESRTLSILGITLTILSLLEFVIDPSKRLLVYIAPVMVCVILLYLQLNFRKLASKK